LHSLNDSSNLDKIRLVTGSNYQEIKSQETGGSYKIPKNDPSCSCRHTSFCTKSLDVRIWTLIPLFAPPSFICKHGRQIFALSFVFHNSMEVQ